MKLKDALIAARKLIESPECWIQGEYYRISDTGIKQYCAAGACREVSEADYEAGGWNILDSFMISALRRACEGCMTTFNDSRTHAEVLAVFDKAIAEVDQLENPKPKEEVRS